MHDAYAWCTQAMTACCVVITQHQLLLIGLCYSIVYRLGVARTCILCCIL